MGEGIDRGDFGKRIGSAYNPQLISDNGRICSTIMLYWVLVLCLTHSTLNPQPSTLNLQPATRIPHSSTLHPQPATLNL